MPARSRSKYRIVAPERDATRVNERIRVREVRVIGSDSEQLGVMTPEDAIALAREEGLDLVEVAATSRPPVCRIMDYGRYKYEQKKKRTSKNKQAHSATLKEVKLRPGTDLHDLNFKLNNVRRFLLDGDKVKVTVMFRGREMVHKNRGRAQLDQVMKQLQPLAKMENPPRMEGRFMSMILIADRDAVTEYKRKEEDAKKEREASEATVDTETMDTETIETDENVEVSESEETETPAEVSEPEEVAEASAEGEETAAEKGE